MLISTYYVQGSKAKAEVHREDDTSIVKYYDINGEFTESRTFEQKSVYYAESAAENWALHQEMITG